MRSPDRILMTATKSPNVRPVHATSTLRAGLTFNVCLPPPCMSVYTKSPPYQVRVQAAVSLRPHYLIFCNYCCVPMLSYSFALSAHHWLTWLGLVLLIVHAVQVTLLFWSTTNNPTASIRPRCVIRIHESIIPSVLCVLLAVYCCVHQFPPHDS